MTKVTDKVNEQKWLDHCAEMNRLYDVEAASLVTDGYTQHGDSPGDYFIKDGDEIMLSRELGSSVWYRTAKTF